MAILNAQSSAHSQSRPPPQPGHKPPLFMRTIVPKGAITRTIACSMLPPHALSRLSSSRNSPPSLKSCRQVVVSTGTSLQVLSVDDDTLSLQPLTDVMMFTSIYDVAAVSTPVPGRDVLVVLSAGFKVSFMQFDDSASRLRYSGQLSLSTPFYSPSESTVRSHPRILATHPRKRMVAVAPLGPKISVFPILFLPKNVNAGKVASVDVDGVVLSLDFLEDDDDMPGDAILLALVQRGKHQVIALYTVGVPPDSTGGLSVTFVGSMITCASRPDDVAVARATSKLTGQPVRPTPPAVAVTRLSGCPYLFAVFVHGKVIAGDARSVILNAHSEEPVPMSVRIEDDIVPSAQSSHMDDTAQPSISLLTALPPPTSTPDEEVMEETHRTPEMPTLSPSAGPAESPALGTPTSSAADSDAGLAATNDGFVTPVQTPVSHREPPSAPLQTRGSGRVGRDDIPPLHPVAHRNNSFPLDKNRNCGEVYLSYSFVPAYISLDVREANGVATAWVDARDHFRDETGDGYGLYFVMESGAMYALKWSERVKDGARTFRIPGSDRAPSSPNWNFCVEYIGDVGPAVSIASLDRKLLFIANDGADGSLRRMHLPHTVYVERNLDSRTAAFKRRLSGRWDGGRYGLEVRQEFLNLAPISDLIIAPSDVTSFKHMKKASAERARVSRFDNWDIKFIPHNEDDLRDQSALGHVLDGGRNEAEVIVCSGIGRYGSIRLIRPGAPVSVFASTDRAFMACNDMWSLRFTKEAMFDAAIVITFAQATRLLLSVPALPNEDTGNDNDENPPKLASLIDGTNTCGLLVDRRTIEVGLVEDGVIAQIHESGIRLVFLKRAGDVNVSDFVSNNQLTESVCENTMDWVPPPGSFISIGTMGAGFILVSVIQKDMPQSVLYLLKCYPNDPSLGLCVVSATELDRELSCLTIPQWTTIHSDRDLLSPRQPPMAVMGTYAPSIEVRLLGPTMELVGRRSTFPWSIHSTSVRCGKGGTAMEGVEPAETRKGLKNPSHDEQSEGSTAISEGLDIMTAVPESLCALEIDGKRLVFAGLRDGSVMSFSFDDRDGGDKMDSGSPNSVGNLAVTAHRKIGYCPVALKSVYCAIGQVVIGQAERPWMCTSIGGGKVRWTPLAFTETRAICSYSVPGAERCFATVADDEAFYICGLRRKSQVSVRSIHIGATPRKVLSVAYPRNSIVVATSCDPISSSSPDGAMSDGEQQLLHGSASLNDVPKRSELCLYDRRERGMTGCISLMRRELVHTLLNWVDFVVVGTSIGLRSYHDSGSNSLASRGRLLLFVITGSDGAGSSSASPSAPMKFDICSEVILPGAVLSGSVSANDETLVVSCNQEVLVFTLIKSRSVLVEIARISARTLVVGLCIKEDIVCMVDRKDSIGFFQLKAKAGKLVRDRSDHRRRIVSDVALVDRTLALAVDRFGRFFSIGYEEGDEPPRVDKGLRMASPLLLKSHRAQRAADGFSNIAMAAGVTPYGLDEFDIVQPESESDHTTDSNEAGGDGGDVVNMESNAGLEQMMGVVESVDNEAAEEIGAGLATEVNDGANVFEGGIFGNEIDTEMGDEDNGDGSVDGGGDGDGDGNGGNSGTDRREVGGIPRNLVSHHSYNMRDTSLRVRIGTFSRGEMVEEMEKSSRNWADGNGSEAFFPCNSYSALCGTVGGAIVTAVGMPSGSFALLSEVENEMSVHPEIVGPALGSSHKRFRTAYGSGSVGTVDGDLLSLFEGLRDDVKRDIARRVGCGGERGVLEIEGMIHELCDRVA